MADYLGYTPNFYDYRVIDLECCGCTSYNYKTWTDFLISAPVTAALNICGDAGENAFGGCSGGCISLPHFDRGDTFDYSGALTRALERGIKVCAVPMAATEPVAAGRREQRAVRGAPD
eukprot:scaffold1503_cov263-Prasinococcus_capsulatus_cf.AAC.3